MSLYCYSRISATIIQVSGVFRNFFLFCTCFFDWKWLSSETKRLGVLLCALNLVSRCPACFFMLSLIFTGCYVNICSYVIIKPRVFEIAPLCDAIFIRSYSAPLDASVEFIYCRQKHEPRPLLNAICMCVCATIKFFRRSSKLFHAPALEVIARSSTHSMNQIYRSRIRWNSCFMAQGWIKN